MTTPDHISEAVTDWGLHRVLVTGATGIVGSWLVRRLLEERAYVVILVRDLDPQTELVRSGDIRHTNVVNGCLEDATVAERAIAGHEIDTVFHLGAQAIVGTANRSPLATFEANIRGTYNLLEACRIQSGLVKRIVVASSDKAYGDSKTLPYTEDMPLNGRHPYDVSKSCADLISSTYANTYGLPVAVARCGNIYGGGDLNWSRIVPGTIRSLLRAERPIIRSNGRFTRDYIFVDDVVEAYLALARKSPDPGVRGEAFNFSCESPMTVLDITHRIMQAVGRMDLEPVILDQAHAEIIDQYLDSARARRVLGWSPSFDLDTGLAATVDWYEKFLAQEDFVDAGIER